MNKKLTEIFQKANQTIANYPMVLLMSLIMTLTVVYAIENETRHEENFYLIKIIICSSLGISLFFALKMLSQRIGKELLLTAGGLLFVVGYFFLLPKNKDDFNEMYAFIIIPTYILLHLFVAFAPYIVSKNTEKSFWEYNKNLFVNLALTAIFTGVLTGGVEVAVISVRELFGFDIEGETYAEIFFTMAILGSAFIFLLFNENGLEHLEKESDYPVVLKFFTQFILIPLLLIYVIILYFYSGKILLAWELPRGWVSYLVLAYSVVGILALLLVHPLKEDTAKSWVKMFGKIFYFSLIPLMILLFTAIFTRLLQYGFTEPRYYVLLLAVWLLTVVFYFVFRKEATIKFIPVSLFLFGLFALLFPYLNAFSVAERSQKKELEKILAENNLLKGGKINFNKEIADTLARQIDDKYQFLNERSEKDYLESLLSDSIKNTKEFKSDKYWRFYTSFKIKATTDTTSNNSNYMTVTSTKSYHDTEGYQYVVALSNLYLRSSEIKIKNNLFEIEGLNSSDGLLKIKLNAKETVDLTPQLENLLKKYNNKTGDFETDDLSIENNIGNYRFKLIFNSVNKSTYNKTAQYTFENCLLLIKEK